MTFPRKNKKIWLSSRSEHTSVQCNMTCMYCYVYPLIRVILWSSFPLLLALHHGLVPFSNFFLCGAYSEFGIIFLIVREEGKKKGWTCVAFNLSLFSLSNAPHHTHGHIQWKKPAKSLMLTLSIQLCGRVAENMDQSAYKLLSGSTCEV